LRLIVRCRMAGKPLLWSLPLIAHPMLPLQQQYKITKLSTYS
jgi:hypothetical protein